SAPSAFASASRMTGTMRPASSATAIPTWMASLVTIASPSNRERSRGCARSAVAAAATMTSVYETPAALRRVFAFVMSTSREIENCGASRNERVIASATARRIFESGSRFSRVAAPAAASAEAGAFAAAAASTSAMPMRPPGPVPLTALMSTPSSCARFRAAGELRTRSPSEDGAEPAGDAGGAPAGGAASAMGSSAVSLSNATSVVTGTLVPAATRMRRRMPEAGDSISMFALSVSTSKSTSPFATWSPSFLCHAMRRPSSIVSPSFGRITRVTLTRGRPSRCSRDELLRGLHDVLDLRHDGLLEVLRVRDRRLEAGETARRRVEVVERVLRDHRGNLRAVAGAPHRFVQHEHAVRLADRREHRILVERHQAAQIDDLGLDAVGGELLRRLQREEDVARPRDDRQRVARLLHVRLAERNEMLPDGDLALRPVQQLVLEEDHGVVVADGRGEQPLRVGGRRRHDDLQAGDVREPRLERLRVLRGVATAGAALRAHDHRYARLPAEHEAVLRGLMHELVHREAREVDVHELDDRPQAGERRADRRPDDAELADRRLADAGRPEGVEQSRRHLERPAVLGDVLAHDDDARIALHLETERVA